MKRFVKTWCQKTIPTSGRGHHSNSLVWLFSLSSSLTQKRAFDKVAVLNIFLLSVPSKTVEIMLIVMNLANSK